MHLLLTIGLFAMTETRNDTARIAATIERLGTPGSTFADYDLLDRNRCVALPLIVDSLLKMPIVLAGKVGGDLGRPENRSSLRTSSLLIALRILTDHDEFGPITRNEYLRLPVYRETPEAGILKRDSLVAALPTGRSRYYGYWVSRGTSFYAPERTQRAIRTQWKAYVRGFDCHQKLSARRWDATFFNGQSGS